MARGLPELELDLAGEWGAVLRLLILAVGVVLGVELPLPLPPILDRGTARFTSTYNPEQQSIRRESGKGVSDVVKGV